ncbi:MAG: hypothetical protein JXA69_10540 [Phycisphaerae bacterium]|nr:hypothetical protein [Phycisphaerae bacterium]
MPLLLAWLLAGCAEDGSPLFGPPPQDATPAATTQPTPVNLFDPAAAGPGSGPPRVIAFEIRLEIVCTSVRLGEVSGSAKLWNHIDEEVLDADWAAHLRRNGLRVGLGALSSWAPIRAVLEASPGVRTREPQRLRVPGGAPLRVGVDRVPRNQSLFLYRPDGRLVGADFLQSVNAFSVDFAIPLTALDSVSLRVTPEVIQPNLPGGWDLTEPQIKPRPTEAARRLGELTFEIVVPPEHFLLIGPSPEVTRELLIGHALLTEQIDGERFESVYFLTPEVTQTARTGLP